MPPNLDAQSFGDRASKLGGKQAPYQGQDVNFNFAGQANELWCEGGELAFIQRMIQESVLNFKSDSFESKNEQTRFSTKSVQIRIRPIF